MTFEKAVTLEASEVTEKNALAVIEALRGERLSMADAAARYARRELAIKKDIKRKQDGKHAERFYRGDAAALPKALRARVAPVLDKVDEARDEATPEPKPAKESKPARKEPAPVKAAPPVVHKPAAKVAPVKVAPVKLPPPAPVKAK